MKISTHTINKKVLLHETDLGGIMHHSNYFHWMEEAEYSLFEKINEPVIGELDEDMKGSGWPRSEVSMKFIKPLRYNDKVEVVLQIKRIRSAGIQYQADFYRVSE